MNNDQKNRREAVKDFEDHLQGMDLNQLEDPAGRGDRLSIDEYERKEGRKKLVLMLLTLAGAIGAGYVIIRFLGPWSFLGLISIVIAYPFFKNKLRAEDYHLWELRIPGQKFDIPDWGTEEVKERSFRRWRITPATWEYLRIEGEPFTLGSNVYLCNFFEPEAGYIGFSYMKTTNNLLRYYDAIWNWMISTVPKLMEQLAMMKEGDKLRAMKQAVILLVKIGKLDPLYLEGKRIIPKKIQSKGPGGV